MLDIDFVRNNKELVQSALDRRGDDFNLAELIKVDELRRELITKVESKRAEQNSTTDLIPREEDLERKKMLIEEMKELKVQIKSLEDKLEPAQELWQTLLMRLSNIPDPSVPMGKSEDDNVVIKQWGEKPHFDFEPKDHIQLMEDLEMIDLERGTKIHGFRGYVLKGAGAKLTWALWRFAQDFFLEKNFNPFIPPSIVRKKWLYGTGHLPGDGDDVFWTQDGDALSATAEIPMMAYYADEILDEEQLPFKALAYSPCYRREAGSHSKDTKGLIRVHEFQKIEQLILCKADHEESVRWHEEITRNHEEFIERLEIPYQRIEICSGDLKSAHVRSWDVELWIPSQENYREIASSSYYHDYQTRRFKTRYRNSNGEVKYAHSLNCTAIPTPRALVAIVENCQQPDGSIMLPPALHKYFGAPNITKDNA
jgi:seryl-tRNA synthetase